MKKRLFPVLALLCFSSAYAQNLVLSSLKVDAAPTLDGSPKEAFWFRAPAVTFTTMAAGAPGPANKSATSVMMRSVYTADSVYFLVSWLDASHNIDRQRWAFDGQKWAKEDQVAPEKGGPVTNSEDKIAFLWSIKAPTFEKDGPWAVYKDMAEAQRAGYNRPVKAAPTGELLDLWHFKVVRTGFGNPAQLDDQFVDDTFDAAKAGGAGRKSDPGEGGYFNNEREMALPDGTKVKVPKYGFKNGDTNAFIMTQAMIESGEVVELTDAQVMALPKGAHLPSVIGRAFSGSRGDIQGQFSWNNGLYMLEFGRKLDTKDAAGDVLFNDLTKTYYFGAATFDNNEMRHAVSDLLELKFK